VKSQVKGSIHWVFVEQGEPVMKTLTDYCKANGIKNGQITGIGAVRNIELGVFVPATKSYHRDRIEDTHELTNYMGNVTLKDGDPFIHAHIVLGDHSFQTLSGHCFEMEVAVVGEFIIQAMNTTVSRKLNPNVGLATWNMGEDHE